MFENAPALAAAYPALAAYTDRVKVPERPVIGREDAIASCLASLARPEVSNVLLLAEPGVGKTSVVQGMMTVDRDRLYLKADLSVMRAAVGDGALPDQVRRLFDDAVAYHADQGREVVVFVDEFHLLPMLSAAAVEAVKPLLADSGTRGIRLIGATTYDEFEDHVKDNQALVERLQRIDLKEPSRETVIEILSGMVDRWREEGDDLPDSAMRDLFETVCEYADRYVPANAQPRKSIMLLDSMFGWYRQYGRPLDKRLLADVIYESQGVKVNNSFDVAEIRESLNSAVIDQRTAVEMICGFLHTCVADLNDKDRPQATFLFTGPTGVGKTECAKQMGRLLFDDDRSLQRLDMSEYATPDAIDRFRDDVTSMVWRRPFCILLLDEIEKADKGVTRLLLQVLGDGRLSDRNGRETSFVNCYVIMTTNASSSVFNDIGHRQADGTGEELAARRADEWDRYADLVRRSIEDDPAFSNELLGRVDAICPFFALQRRTLLAIARKKLADVAALVRDRHGAALSYVGLEDEADGTPGKLLRYLVLERVEREEANAGGARRLVHHINGTLVSAVARTLNENPGARMVEVACVGDLVVDDKHRAKSGGRIEARKVA